MDKTGRYAGLVPDFKPREVPETTSGSKSALIDRLSAEMWKAEKGRRLAGEIIATLIVNIDRGHLPEILRPTVDVWKRQLTECGG